MKYLCTAIVKEITNRKNFTDRQEAIEYFRSLQDQQNQRDMIKHNKLEEVDVVSCEEKYDQFEQEAFSGDLQMILCVRSIYRNGGSFEVTEDQYYYIGQIREGSTSFEIAKSKMTFSETQNRIYFAIYPETQENVSRSMKAIKKTRMQIIRNYRKEKNRLKNAAA